ncbi:Predicted amidohydrolase [Dethiosulfatibacter aminovorans DSM 17477]|uniref:Predicted amidohydrolase n=1 Tax=Dethiosulfatibacter aminovorans DSM 17477 TaxID=1121476 RepID=A0A1M6MQ69_9FIRM|nr:carbon-nitrogen hydrolase family protein [Dethiosulfatibacter aminovorans]SHJ85621.1 Predicted amidohydrolase [Dethiosulfatibacter aminovorans DSM 17477]
MANYLNVGIIQMPISSDVSKNLEHIKKKVDEMMSRYVTPELILGVEFGISLEYAEEIPGDITNYLSGIAKQYGICFIPGTMAEKSSDLEEGEFYNTCPVFGPDGSLLKAYRKKVPFKPGEPSSPSMDDDYCIFEIEEKNIKVGILICYDHFFPEIPRKLALMGAEIMLCPSSDSMEFKYIPEILPRARALENECFFIWTSDAKSELAGFNSCGSSVIIDPTGNVMHKCSEIPMTYVITLDIDAVKHKREYGADQHLNSLRRFNIKFPSIDSINDYPVYQGMGSLTYNPKEYKDKVREVGMGTIGKVK